MSMGDDDVVRRSPRLQQLNTTQITILESSCIGGSKLPVPGGSMRIGTLKRRLHPNQDENKPLKAQRSVDFGPLPFDSSPDVNEQLEDKMEHNIPTGQPLKNKRTSFLLKAKRRSIIQLTKGKPPPVTSGLGARPALRKPLATRPKICIDKSAVSNSGRSSSSSSTTAATSTRYSSTKPSNNVPTSVASRMPVKAGAASQQSHRGPPPPRQPKTSAAALRERSESRHDMPRKSPRSKSTVAAPGSKKRAGWDLKGRLEDMEVLMRKQNDQNQTLSSRLGQLEEQKVSLECTVEKTQIDHSSAQQQIDLLLNKLKNTEQELESLHTKSRKQIDELKDNLAASERRRANLESDLTVSQTENCGLKNSLMQLTTSHSGMKAQLESTIIERDQNQKIIYVCNDKIKQLEKTVGAQSNEIDRCNGKIRDGESSRRLLHNAIQELKGNIRVYCRIRPLLSDELLPGVTSNAPTHIYYPDPDMKTVELDNVTRESITSDSSINATRNSSLQRTSKFKFDHVFSHASTQGEVFGEISQLVQSVLDGYNVCIFAYGQTGSGKTFTMEGPSGHSFTADLEGMIPRAVRQVFESAADLRDKGWTYEFEASFVEIYNDSVRDLLNNDAGINQSLEIKLVEKPETTKKGGARGAAARSNEVNVTVPGLTIRNVTQANEVEKLLKIANQNRAVAATKCNERSSRSHSVFCMKLKGSNSVTEETCEGTLNLVDLAGSERLKESGSEGDRLKETQAINKSLSALGQVITSLANKDSYIPYRNSKLTYLLQLSLGGNSKTLMFVNVSPREEFVAESINSLRFAKTVNQCHIGTAQQQRKK